MAAQPIAALAGVRQRILGRGLALGPGPGAARADQERLVVGRRAVFARERFVPVLAEVRDACGGSILCPRPYRRDRERESRANGPGEGRRDGEPSEAQI